MSKATLGSAGSAAAVLAGISAGILAAMPSHAAVVSYVAAPSYTNSATILSTGASDSATGLPPADVSATWSPGFEGAASGSASASVTSLVQSIDGFHIAGSLSGTSTAGVSSSLTSNAAITGGYYEFVIAGPTMVYLTADFSRSHSGFGGGLGGFRANICFVSQPCPGSGVNGFGTGNVGGEGYGGGLYLLSAELDSGAYLLDFYASDSVIGGVPGGVGTFSSSYDVQLQFVPMVVPVPPAVLLFGSALGVMGVLRRKRVR